MPFSSETLIIYIVPLILTTFIVLALGSFAYAQMGMGGCWSNGTQVTSSAQAENMVKSMIGNNGWNVTGSKELKLRKGTGYKVEVKNLTFTLYALPL